MCARAAWDKKKEPERSVADGNRRTLSGEAPRDRGAHPARSSGDEGHAPGQFVSLRCGGDLLCSFHNVHFGVLSLADLN